MGIGAESFSQAIVRRPRLSQYVPGEWAGQNGWPLRIASIQRHVAEVNVSRLLLLSLGLPGIPFDDDIVNRTKAIV